MILIATIQIFIGITISHATKSCNYIVYYKIVNTWYSILQLCTIDRLQANIVNIISDYYGVEKHLDK